MRHVTDLGPKGRMDNVEMLEVLLVSAKRKGDLSQDLISAKGKPVSSQTTRNLSQSTCHVDLIAVV